MMKYVVCGTSVEDVEAGVKAMKMAIANGATCGVGGSTMAEVEQSLDAMNQMIGGVAPSQMGRDCLRSPNGYCPYCKDEATVGDNVTIHDLILGKADVFICENEDEDEEDIGFCDGYMALSEIGEELSGLCDSPEEAMADAISEGYDLDEIGIYAVRVYDDEGVEVTATIHRPLN